MGRKCKAARALLLAALGIFAGSRQGWADQIILTNGHTVSGDIIAQDADSVTLDLSDVNESLTRKYPRAHIKQINTWGHPSSQGPEYVTLPVQGTIGLDVSAHALKAGIASALRLSPKYLVFYIDSDGGNVGELKSMVDAIHALPPDVHAVAFVHKAYSAAAVLAMSCPKIFMTSDAVIGAAVPLMHDENGLPQDLNAKFASAIEAEERTWVSAAGHDDLLLRGMMELDLELYLTQIGNQVVVRTMGPGKLLKSDNQILTLTSADALQCGLARQAKDFTDVGQQLGGPTCSEPSQRPWDAVVRNARHDKHEAMVDAVKAKITPELIAIVSRERVLVARITDDRSRIAQFQAQQGANAAGAIGLLKSDAESAAQELADLHQRYLALQGKVPQYDD